MSSCLDWKLPFYRINYGNGQVSGCFKMRKDALKELRGDSRYSWLDIRDVDGWEPSRLTQAERDYVELPEGGRS